MSAHDPEAVLRFWFADAADDPAKASGRGDLWFGSSPETDALVRERFTATVEAAGRGDLDAWTHDPRAALALVILLDQFPRNVWRGTAHAFAFDPRALAVAEQAIGDGHFERLSPVEQAFLILPFQHSESIVRQRGSVRLSREIARAAPPAWRSLLDYYTSFAERHLALIERFGRFPHRNRVLGRESTAEELAYLSGGGETFGQG
jgi:uncharacterized protein (DUF924 family)